MKTIFMTLMTMSLLIGVQAKASTNGSSTGIGGGGDQFVLDFVRVAKNEIYPWLVRNQTNIKGVNPDSFIQAVNPEKIQSADHVFETCDGSTQGREVDACYNQQQDKFYLSRSRYPLYNSPAKRGLIAHEIFRKLGIEGDSYQITSQMVFDDLASPGVQIPLAEFSTNSCYVVNMIVDAINSSLNIQHVRLFIDLSCNGRGDVVASLIISGQSKPAWDAVVSGLGTRPTEDYKMAMGDALRKLSAGLARAGVPLNLAPATDASEPFNIIVLRLSEAYPRP